jgi:hypothetical protein
MRLKMGPPINLRIIVTATGFPAIALALGFILILFGNATNNEEMFTAGKLFVIFGFAAFAISLLVLLAIAKIR